MATNKDSKPKGNTSFIQSITSNEALNPSSLDEMIASSEPETEEKSEDKPVKKEKIKKEKINEPLEERKRRPFEQVFKKKKARDNKPVYVSVSIHEKLSLLSNFTEYNISDITESIIEAFLIKHSEDIKGVITESMLKKLKGE